MRRNGHNAKRHELFCQFCGRRMNKSRRDAKYHDSCRVAAWRERKYEAERAAQIVQQPNTRQGIASRGTLLGKAAGSSMYERRVGRKIFKPLVDEEGYWAPAVNGKRWYETDEGIQLALPAPDDELGRMNFNQ